jgi:hypothetical protein
MDRHILGGQAEAKCKCGITFPFLPNPKILLLASEYILVAFSSFDMYTRK